MDTQQQNEDALLVSRSRSGDAKAFEQLVHRHSALVGGIAFQILGDSEGARDVAQDVFLKVHRRLVTLADPMRFRSWLCGIARTTAIDWMRRNAKTKSLDALEQAGREPAAPAGREGSLEQEELYAKVLRVVNGLPRVYRDVMMMRHLRHMSYADIARELATTPATVESRLYRARLMLRETLSEYFE